ncbi:MAG: hypothetical protein L6R36_001097 [Xanthoria steineri]|nr:MAG: hypothetical protein L6R36_001097 [Xanthoria steineri]
MQLCRRFGIETSARNGPFVTNSLENFHSRPQWPASQPRTGPFICSSAQPNHVQVNTPAIDDNGISLPAGNIGYQDLGPAVNENGPQWLRDGRNAFDTSASTFHHVQEISDFYSLSNIDSNIDWAKFYSIAGVIESQTSFNLNSYGYVFPSPSASNVQTQAIDPNNSHQDFVFNSYTATASSETQSVQSIAFDPGTSHTRNAIYSSNPELINPEPEGIDPAFQQANTRQLDGYPPNLARVSNAGEDCSWKHPYTPLPCNRLHPVYDLTPKTQYPHDPNVSSINQTGYPLPVPPIPSAPPQTALEYFADLATQPCADLTPSSWSNDDPSAPAYPSHHPPNPPRTLLTSLPPLPPVSPSPPTSPPPPQQQNPPTPPNPPPIVPASTQHIFSTVTADIAKINASRGRDHDFGFPNGRRCFGFPLAPSRGFGSWQPPVQGRRRPRGPDRGPRKRVAKEMERDGDVLEGGRAVKRARAKGKGDK